jgi:MFS family permease
MYAIDWSMLLTRSRERTAVRLSVSRTVWALGFTSLFTDISSEMVASILPMYLVLQLGMQPAAFGFIDGLYQGAAALVRIAAGIVSDRWQRHKEVAGIGYGLSALCRVALLAVGSTWTAIAGVVAVDRIGKGIRTAPRDALISLATPSRDLATAFGVHRGLDATGAMLGPFLAFLILAWMPARYDVLFASSFVVAVIGVAILVLFVEPLVAGAGIVRKRARLLLDSELLRAPRFRGIMIAAFLLGLPTISDAFIFLSLQRKLDMGATVFPLFYVGASLFTALLSVPLGRLADRLGRTTILFAGYVALMLVYLTIFLPGGSVMMALATLALLGAYYAATDGVLTAMAAAVLPSESTGSGLSLLATATNVARILASVAFGIVWSYAGLNVATGLYLGAMVIATATSTLVLTRAERA